jgi:acrylyl-CoA reductase (NADPH)/3-hydroxypropionyl-CoA dehydratase/3-hydroxypropionyl-CoA synthetase
MSEQQELVRLPEPVRTNPIRTREDWEEMRERARTDPGSFHGEIAREQLHWYEDGVWATRDGDGWTGFADDTAPVDPDWDPDHEPWDTAFDDSDPPLYRWFVGGETNACFNEVDRHVLAGHGEEIAFHFEGDRWDQSKTDGRGGPVVSEAVTRRELLYRTVVATQVLRDLGVEKGDRVAMNMPNVLEQIYYMEACKRLGAIYTPVFGGFSDKTLSDRIAELDAEILITSDGGYRNAEVVDYKEQYGDPALDDYLPVETVEATVSEALAGMDLDPDHAATIEDAVAEAVAGEITVDRADAMRGVGHALDDLPIDPDRASDIRTGVARALVEADHVVDDVIVVEHTGQEITMHGRDHWAGDLEAAAAETVLENAREAGFDAADRDDLADLDDRAFVEAMWATKAPEPVDAEYPLFVIFTSGSTGKPKGVVHVHGGYTAGIAHTMRTSFDVVPGEDTIFVVADPGWITGQSYLISASLTTRTTSVVAEGSPLYPDAGRFSSIIERYDVDVFKAGVTFLKTVMEDQDNVADMQEWSTDSLRVATFCAEPVNEAVQEFGMAEVCPWYINSYWATEHGGIVWTHFYGNDDFELRPDAHTYPCPWVFGDVWVEEEEHEGGSTWRRADPEERGEIIIREPYPYLMRTVWGDNEGFDPENPADWQGNRERFEDTYWVEKDGEYAYLQGDVAKQYEDDSFSLHGRSDEVINVSGHRMGTEEIEGAMLRDKQLNPDTPVANVVVVGAPHHEKGLVPVAFVQTRPGENLTTEVERRLERLVREEKGVVAVPDSFIEVEEFPETRSGKYMRRMLTAMLSGDPVGDTTTLKNPDAVDAIQPKAERWRRRQRIAREQDVLDEYRFFTVQYNTVPGAEQDVATVIVDNPPVNALNERALDELNTIADHLDREEGIGAVIVASEGSAFVAGADIEQFLEEVHDVDEARTFPTKAHRAFEKLETLSVPVVAAVDGAALGGGNELQLATHYTVAEDHATFGQPELRLNLLPGYGGTQRFTRVLDDRRGTEGVIDAVTAITNGRDIDAEDAAEMGLVDELCDAPARVRAAELARGHIRGEDSTLRDAREDRLAARERWSQPGEFDDAVLEDDDVARNRRQCASRSTGRERAFERAIEAVRTGFEEGIDAGYEAEADNFAEAVVDPEGGKTGIEKFLDGQAEPLPPRPREAPPVEQADELDEELVELGEPFYPGVDDVPDWQYGFAVEKDMETGDPEHGDPEEAEVEGLYPVEEPGPNEVLLYMLTSEVNFNDVWAITGIPVSQFDNHDRDRHITGSGGSALIVDAGEAVRENDRVQVGDLVTVYSGQSDLLSPRMGLDPMYAGFSIQGYEEPDGSHQQFMIAQAPQVLPIPEETTIEEAGSYVLALGTVYRALFTTLEVESGTTMFVEGGATGTGWETLRTGLRNGMSVTGLCSSEERAARIEDAGGGAINRKADDLADIWGPIPEDPDEWDDWKAAGEPLLERFRDQHGSLADYAASHAGEQSFPRSFQLLDEGGELTFWGASTGYRMTFLGKPGASTPEEMFDEVDLRAGEGLLVYYGTDTGPEGVLDETGLRAIEAGREADADIVVVAYTDEQAEFVESLGYGDAVEAVLSIEGLERREDEFEWPETLPDFPHPQADPEAFKRAVQEYTDSAFKPLGKAVGQYLRTSENPRGNPDVVFERAGHDALGVSTMLVRPHTGRVVYSEDMGDRRYSFYAPQVWMRQREIYMPTAAILGSHLSNAYEVQQLNAEIDAGALDVTTPEVVDWDGLPTAHQKMWDNEHDAESYVVDHALPAEGLRDRRELFKAWGRGGSGSTDADTEAEADADAEVEAADDD